MTLKTLMLFFRTRLVLASDMRNGGGFTAIVADVAQYELNDVRSIKQDSFNLAIKHSREELKKLESDKKAEQPVEKQMTQMAGIFYMLYSAEKSAGYTIFNEKGDHSANKTWNARAARLRLKRRGRVREESLTFMHVRMHALRRTCTKCANARPLCSGQRFEKNRGVRNRTQGLREVVHEN